MKFKPLIMLFSLLLIIATVNPASAGGDDRQITIAGISTGANTDPAHPGEFLKDNNPDTYWSAIPNNGQAWAELNLNQTALIYGLQISGSLATNSRLTVESYQNGYWIPFCGGSLQSIPEQGIIDLSYDRAVTAKLRLRLDDSGAEASKIAEIKVLGCPAGSVLQLIQPAEIKYSKDIHPTTPARFLSDRNLFTAWRIDGDDKDDCAEIRNNHLFTHDAFWDRKIRQTQTDASRQVELELDGSYRLSNINLFITPDAAGTLIVKIGNGRHWQEVGRFNLEERSGWQRIDLGSQAVETERVLIQLADDRNSDSQHGNRDKRSGKPERSGGIGEVELWGYGAYDGMQRRSLQAVPQAVSQPLNYCFDLGEDQADLRGQHLALAVAGIYNYPLTIELNGLPLELQPALKINGNTVYQYNIPADSLWAGENFIRIRPGEPVFTLLQLQVYQNENNGEVPLPAGSLNDGLLLTPATETGSQFNLARESFIEAVEIYAPGNLAATVAAQTGTGIIELSPIQTDPGYLRFQGGISASGLNIVNHGGLPFAEIRVLGNPGPNTAPELTVLWPQPDDRPWRELPELNAGDREYLLGRVDNSEATITVNGRSTRQSGNYFWIRLAELGLDYGEVNTITVIASAPDGATTSKQLVFFWSDSPDYRLDQQDVIYHTDKPAFTISGQVGSRQYEILINDKPVTINHNRRFAAEVSLAEGFNLITVSFNYSQRGKAMHYTIHRRVVRESGGPVLLIDTPLPGTVTNSGSLIVSGIVAGRDPSVTVNRTRVTVTNGYFTSQPLALVEGSNTIKVEASDAYGRKTSRTLTVIKDSRAPVISGISPANGFLSGSAAVTVNGKISDANQVYVYVNGQLAIYQNGSFSITINLPDGENQVTISARDQAGNTASASLKIKVDTTPPLTFTPRANPAGWTNNNKPTITFGTTDGFSGIDHYEIAVGNNAFTTPVTSPYTFAAPVPDGEQTVKVKAVDKAGNFTIGEVKAYIDTTPPAVPENFEVISGVGRMVINWQDNGGEVKGYRITRAPAFSDGRFKELFRANELAEVAQYFDTEVTQGVNYSYTLQAIDRAGNYSTVTAKLTNMVGATDQEINTQGGIVKFDNCSLILPEGALTAPGRVVMKQTVTDLPENTYATKVGTAYNFSLVDQTGQEIDTKFNKLVTLIISYADLQIPAGFIAEDLGIYWYNKVGGYWEKLEYAFNDTISKKITVKLHHFSDYQVMASKYFSPSLDSYYDMGVSPFQSYFQDNVESVSPMTGSLIISATDLKLPGRGGFDLVLKRIYDSGAAQQQRFIENNKDGYYSKAPIDTFGCGWSLNIPWIEQTDKGKFIRLPEGQTIKIEKIEDNSDATWIYHEGIHFKMKKTTDGYILTMNTGIIYVFDSKGRVTTATDPSGENTITYIYNQSNDRQIDNIQIDNNIPESSNRRKVSFHYKTVGNKSVIDYITTGTTTKRKISYDYNYENSNDVLTEVYDPSNPTKDPTKRKTHYSYRTDQLRAGDRIVSEQDIDNSFYYRVDLLNSITYPTGKISTYEYEFRDQYYKEDIKRKVSFVFTVTVATGRYYGTKILIKKHTVGGVETIYDYYMNDRFGTIDHEDFVPAYTYMGYCQITAGEMVNKMTFRQLEGNNFVDFPKEIDNYKGALALENYTTIGNNQEVESVLYHYNLPIRAIIAEEHFRKTNLIYKITNEYDGWGNLTHRLDGSRNLEETWSYYPHNRIKNLPLRYSRKNINLYAGTSSTVTTTYSQYDNNIGKPKMITVNDDSGNKVTKFTYDDKGNIKTKVEEFNENLTTEFFYDTTYQAFPVKRIIYGVRDADGRTVNIETEAEYDFTTGLKKWEKDARGFVTSYNYDNLNRVTKITLPDDDGDDSNNPYREYNFNDSDNTCVFYNEKRQKTTYKFDGLGRLTEVTKDTALYSGGVKTIYRYNNRGQIDRVTDPLENNTSYKYDGLNRVVKITYPGGAFVTLSYDDTTNTVTVTDETGGQVTEIKDRANRVIQAKQFCSFNDAIENIYTWQFFYDSLGNKVRQIDPGLNHTDQEFDAFGHLIAVQLPTAPILLPGASSTADYRPTLKYDYNPAGFRIAEISADENAKGTQNKINYEYDQLGRLIKTTVQAKDIFTGEMVTMVTKSYYDAVGNKIRTIDPKNRTMEYSYSARGYLLNETDSATGNITRYQYDVLGNKTAATDPRGDGIDGSFTTWYKYDDLNRLWKTILPDNTPGDLSNNPYTEITYDAAGNKTAERDPNGVITSYSYTPRNWVETVSQNGQLKTKYVYDAKGNQIEIWDALNNVTKKEYDSLGRVRKVIQTGGDQVIEEYKYDAVGNRIAVSDGRHNTTTSTYNGLGWLTSVQDPLENLTQYFYDPNGNQVQVITPNNLIMKNSYDELNRLIETTDSLRHSTKYSYDLAGNKEKIVDRRGTAWVYQYYPNYLVKRVDLTGSDGTSYFVEYTYDKVGNRQEIKDSGNIILYNYQNGVYRDDPLNRLNSVDRSFDGTSYRTEYQYDQAGLLTGIKYPEAADWLKYNYNSLNQLNEVVGFTASRGISYDANSALSSLKYANGVYTTYSYDNNQRLEDLRVVSAGADIFKQHYTYDASNNIKTIDDGKGITTFDYDADNQLIRSVTPGRFLEQDPTPGSYGLKVGDYLGATWIDFTPVLNAMIGLDYNSSSIGIDFGVVAPGIKKLQVIPDGAYQTHRIIQRTIDLYTSGDNLTYQMVPRNNWEFVKDTASGVITITLNERLAARYLKVHVKFDERDDDFNPKNKAEFLNDLAKMLRVYQEATDRTEEFEYDPAGNRKLQRVTLVQTDSYTSSYYTGTDRLKTNGKYAFIYDDAGNVIEKGNRFTINGDNVIFTIAGEGVEYWRYEYDLLNRLIKVTKNGTMVSEYAYDPEGLRVVKRAKGETTHYVFEGTEPIFEKKISTDKIKSYVYALGKHLARVDGVIGDTSAKVYFYHTDHLGSVRVITDQAGKVVFNADYYAFGTKYASNGDFDEVHGFTGKEYDADIGMYYYNARWYDPDLGRFISEDPAADPNNPNLYSYCGNNPVMRIDPSGEYWWIVFILMFIQKVGNGISADHNGGYFWAGYTNTTTTFTFQYNFDSQGNSSWGPRQEPTGGDLQYSGGSYNDQYNQYNSYNQYDQSYVLDLGTTIPGYQLSPDLPDPKDYEPKATILSGTVVNRTGKVLSVSKNGDLGVYLLNDNGSFNKIGETYFQDTFKIGDRIIFGVDKTKEITELAKAAKKDWAGGVLFGSMGGGKYDVKSQWRKDEGLRINDGILLFGKYCTVEDAGNLLAGMNAASMGLSYEAFQRMSGALHYYEHVDKKAGFVKKMFGLVLAAYGDEYGPAPLYGEETRQYNMSLLGYYYYHNIMR